MSAVTRWYKGASLGAILLLEACASPRGAPEPVTSAIAADLARSATGATLAADCLGSSESVDLSEGAAARRNRLVAAQMFVVDAAYLQYERRLLRYARGNGRRAAGDLSRALRATDSLPLANRGAVGRNYLSDQILTILMTQMRTNRAASRAILTGRFELPYDQWNACAALSDVVAYEQAGTLAGALAALAASAARPGEPERQAPLSK